MLLNLFIGLRRREDLKKPWFKTERSEKNDKGGEQNRRRLRYLRRNP